MQVEHPSDTSLGIRKPSIPATAGLQLSIARGLLRPLPCHKCEMCCQSKCKFQRAHVPLSSGGQLYPMFRSSTPAWHLK
eukprot:1160975-Pelagomonas_calceolata.AAC.6